MKLSNYIKNSLEFMVYYILSKLLKGNEIKTNTILLINTGEIGDLVVSSLLLENDNIFAEYSNVSFLVKEQYLSLFKDYTGPIRFIGYNYKKYKYSLVYKVRFIKRMRSAGFEQIIHLTAARGILNEEITHLLNGRRYVVISSYTKYLGGILKHYFDSKYQLSIAANVVNEYEKHIELIKYFNKDAKSEIVFFNGKTFNVSQIGNTPKTGRIIIAPVTSTMKRELPFNTILEVIEYFSIRYEVTLLGSKTQSKLLYRMKGNNQSIKVLAGEIELNEIASVMDSSKLFIGLDSGMTHIALKLRVPVLAIIGGGEFGRFFPYKESAKVKYLYNKMECFSCHWDCSQKEMFCLSKISSHKIIEESSKILAQ